MFDKINVLIKEYFIRTGKNSHTPFEVFIKERLFNQYDIF
ncbi:DUF4765 family protein [Escherichia coli]|nr:DUF4765 family protein [Escherichia coli]